MTPTVFSARDLPVGSRRWQILDVMRRGKSYSRNAWAALLIDVDPDEHCSGAAYATKRVWLDLGRHRSFDDAWAHAEGLLGPRH